MAGRATPTIHIESCLSGEWCCNAARLEALYDFSQRSWACVALACALSFSVVPVGAAQASQSSDSAGWSSPRGYDLAYPENGTPNMVARQGYAAGFNQGRADLSRGQSFRPTENKAFAHAKIPKGMDKDQFKTGFRESFVRGYTNAYKGL
jgi:hypothetical protein